MCQSETLWFSVDDIILVFQGFMFLNVGMILRDNVGLVQRSTDSPTNSYGQATDAHMSLFTKQPSYVNWFHLAIGGHKLGIRILWILENI